MLALGVVGLTTYRRSQLKETHDQSWKELKRAQHRLRVSAKEVELLEPEAEEEEESTDEPESIVQSKELDGPLVQFSLELLCGCLLKDSCDTKVPSIVGAEFVRLNWANRSALKGRIALLNSKSPYLDQLLKRAIGEELAGFALYGTADEPLRSTEAAGLLKQVEDAVHSANAEPVPIWLIYGSGAREIAQRNAVRIHSVEEEPVPADQYFLPGGKEGIYELAWLSDSVANSSAQLATKMTGVFDTIAVPFSGWDWGWGSSSSGKINEIDHYHENSLATRMETMNVCVRVQ